MTRNGGYMSKLSSMHSFRKSFASSRLQELVHADDLIDESSVLCDPSPYTSSLSLQHNSRKRPLTDDSDSDVEAVLSQIYIPPTPCIISAIEDEDPSSNQISFACLSTTDGEVKKARMSVDEIQLGPGTANTENLLPSIPVHEETGGIELEAEVDVVGGIEETSEWSIDSSRTETLNAEPMDEVMDEFRLDFHLTRPNISDSDSEVQAEQLSDHDELKPSDETKENTCEPVSPTPSSCGPGLNIPLTDLPVHQHKCPNSVGSVGSPENGTSPEKQFSSCGHSSIFGELQSVVFHSLIASLET